MKFAGTVANALVTEFLGPWDNHNYTGSDPAYVVVTMSEIGASGSAVKVQQNLTPVNGYYNLTYGLRPSESGWVDVGPVTANGTTLVEVLAQPTINWLRVIITVPGTNPIGSVIAGGRWDNLIYA